MNESKSLLDRIATDDFAGYAYAYPHKTSYRPLQPSVDLQKAWKHENKDSVFLYVHLPFCEMRCGFCNLFTTVQPPIELVAKTLDAIERQSRASQQAIGARGISQIAFGGGTPSFLNCEELHQLFEGLCDIWPINWKDSPISFETSPGTIDAAKIQLLRGYHVDRISMGIQSFVEVDLKGLGRPQRSDEVEKAIALIQSSDFPVFNIDLIYGSQGQTLDSWRYTVDEVISIHPEEIYLYPLYVRELTGLRQTGNEPSRRRREMYLSARDALLDSGYEQCSMRLFRSSGVAFETEHRCQEDGMIGLGPGARSYTKSLHYSSEYAVGQSGVRKIISTFNSLPSQAFRFTDYGVFLNDEEQRRRYLIKSLLQSSGLDLAKYEAWFSTRVMDDFPQLHELMDLDLGRIKEQHLVLKAEGLALSDVIGPWLYSPAVTSRMDGFELV